MSTVQRSMYEVRVRVEKNARSRHKKKYWEAHNRETTRCEDCGRLESHPHVKEFHVHHIDRDPTNGDMDNLVALCEHCHYQRHGWEPRGGVGDWKGRMLSLGGDGYED